MRSVSVTSQVARVVPPQVKRLVPTELKRRALDMSLPSRGYLASLLRETYTVDKLVGVSPEDFERRIRAFGEIDDAQMEGYQSAAKQRARSVRFQWAEPMDFGTFSVDGMAPNRTPLVLATFIDWLSALPKRLDGKRVLDIGCWTGTTSLLLAAMGAQVVAIEEVKKYVDCLTYLRDSFGVENLEPRHLSLYDLVADEFQDAFDYVLFAGVLYHLSDPVLGLRITFNALRPGGQCLMETAISKGSGRTLEYAGSGEVGRDPLSANWFFPTSVVVKAMMAEVGYVNLRSHVRTSRNKDRMIAAASKTEQCDMLRAGLSMPKIR